jgi:hypothetical protein
MHTCCLRNCRIVRQLRLNREINRKERQVVAIEQLRQLSQATAVGTTFASVVGLPMQMVCVVLIAVDLVTRWGW